MQTPLILCVDDELSGLLGREALLKLKGYYVLTSTSPHEALELFSSQRVDLVVLDYQMVEMRGDLLASRMKQLKPEIPIMLLSARDELAEENFDQVDIFFSKTEPPWKFAEAVQVLLNGRKDFFSKWLRDWRRKRAAA